MALINASATSKGVLLVGFKLCVFYPDGLNHQRLVLVAPTRNWFMCS